MADKNTKEISLETRANKLGVWIAGEIDKAVSGNQYKCPEGYDYATELQTALLKIALNVKDKNGKPALTVCTSQSIYHALREMCILGLSMSIDQVYPIIYEDKLSIQTSYFGEVVAFNRIFPDLEVRANVLHEGDEYELEYDDALAFQIVRKVRTRIENLDKPIVAAYAIISNKSTKEIVGGDLMTWREIETSWGQSRSVNKNIHKKFPTEMAKRTVLKRAVKKFVKTADVAAVKNKDVLHSYQRVSDEEYEPVIEVEAAPMDEHRATLIAGKSKGSKGLEALVKPQEEEKEAKPVEATAVSDPKHEEKESSLFDEPIVAEEEEEGNEVDYDSIPF